MTTSINRQTVGSSNADALRGASLAFKQKPPPAPVSATATGNGHVWDHYNGAGARPAGTVSAQTTGGSSVHEKLQPPNPSFIAATLAASRSGSPTAKVRQGNAGVAERPGALDTASRPGSYGAAGGGSRRGSNDNVSRASSEHSEMVVSESIAPTNSLISMFEESGAKPKRREGQSRRDAGLADKRAQTKSVEELREVVRRQMREGQQAVQERAAQEKEKKISPRASQAAIRSRDLSPLPPPRKPAQKPEVLAPKPNPQGMAPVNASQGTTPLSKPRPKTPPPLNARKTPSEERQRASPRPRKLSLPKSTPVQPKSPSSPPRANHATSSPPEVLSPIPRRMSKLHSPITPPQKLTLLSSPQSGLPTDPSPDPQKSSPAPLPRLISKPAPSPAAQKAAPPAPPKPRGSNNRKTPQKGPNDASRPPPPRRKMSESNDVFVSAPTSPENARSPPPAKVYTNRPVVSSPPSPTRSVSRRLPSHTGPSQSNLDVNNLTSAIVAGSLASSLLSTHNTGTASAPPLPARQRSPRLKQTLRQPTTRSDSEDDDRMKVHHKHKLRSGKHKHHEGSRKKWRDEIRQRERKRYEAVWASNRGHLLSPPASSAASASTTTVASNNGAASPPRDESQCVANVVVRDIWRRSRLPPDELAEVWDLVDRSGGGSLDRQEFVVGMWLVDQRLRGRKIPIRVSDSVWGSASGLAGVRVNGPKIR